MYGRPETPGQPHPSASLPALRRVEGRVFHPAGTLDARTGSYPGVPGARRAIWPQSVQGQRWLDKPCGQEIETAAEPVVGTASQADEAPELGPRLAKRLPRLPRSPDRSAGSEFGIEPWACDHAAS